MINKIILLCKRNNEIDKKEVPGDKDLAANTKDLNRSNKKTRM